MCLFTFLSTLSDCESKFCSGTLATLLLSVSVLPGKKCHFLTLWDNPSKLIKVTIFSIICITLTTFSSVWELTLTSTWPLLGNRSKINSLGIRENNNSEWKLYVEGELHSGHCHWEWWWWWMYFRMMQVNYILGSTGRSFVVGYGVNPPTHCHHRGASCYGPNRWPACSISPMIPLPVSSIPC